MKNTKKKNGKISYKKLEAQYKWAINEKFRLERELSETSHDGKKYKDAYITLKNNVGKYLAIYASVGAADGDERKNLRDAIFSEPRNDGNSTFTIKWA